MNIEIPIPIDGLIDEAVRQIENLCGCKVDKHRPALERLRAVVEAGLEKNGSNCID